MNPSCYVVGAAEMARLVNALALLALLPTLFWVVGTTDWFWWSDRLRVYRRRRRLASIRQARAPQ